MKRVAVRITALLMNRFTGDTEVKVSSGTSAVYNGDRGTPREQAAQTAYLDEKGKLYIPSANLFSCLIAAGKFHKAGKNKVTTARSSLIPAGLAIIEPVLSLGTSVFEVDSRSVVIPATGGRVMKHRARLDKWQLSFEIEVDTDVFSTKFIRELMDDAGKKIGLGDFRPDRKGLFGKFVVDAWKETN